MLASQRGARQGGRHPVGHVRLCGGLATCWKRVWQPAGALSDARHVHALTCCAHASLHAASGLWRRCARSLPTWTSPSPSAARSASTCSPGWVGQHSNVFWLDLVVVIPFGGQISFGVFPLVGWTKQQPFLSVMATHIGCSRSCCCCAPVALAVSAPAPAAAAALKLDGVHEPMACCK